VTRLRSRPALWLAALAVSAVVLSFLIQLAQGICPVP
jgi:hypothetical protein